MKKKIICIIPARLASSRFPEKILAPLRGKPLLQWVWEAATQCPQFNEVVIAVDAQKTFDMVVAFGGSAIMTSPQCNNGTERLIEIWKRKEVVGDIWVNWQGDEPLIHAQMIKDLLQDTSQGDVWTLKKKLLLAEEIISPTVVKVVTDRLGYALYFSRAQIPYARDVLGNHGYFYKHVGIYAYSNQALEVIQNLSTSPLEEIERLEQLSFLYHGLKIAVHETSFDTIGIDLPEHLALVEERLERDLASIS